MCGYIRRVTDCPEIQDLLEDIGLGELADRYRPTEHTIEHYYPAFGGDPERKIHGLIVPDDNGARTVDATWWYDCEPIGKTLKVGERTTFNARNLDSPYWRGPLLHRRALVVATGLGETKVIDGIKRHFLIEGTLPFLLGALYQRFDNGCYSCAVMTRDIHPRFEPYHDKAFPCFIPAAKAFVDAWLYDIHALPKPVATYLEHPRIVVPLRISPVKTFRSGETARNPVHLRPDP